MRQNQRKCHKESNHDVPKALHCQGQVQEQQEHERQAENGGVAAPQVEFIHRETEKQQNSGDTPDFLA